MKFNNVWVTFLNHKNFLQESQTVLLAMKKEHHNSEN